MRVDILTADTPNKNNRVYPRHVIENAINQALPRVREKRFLVTTQIIPDMDDIPLAEIGGLVTELVLEGNSLMAEIEFLDNPNGAKLEEGIKSGIISIRTSGVGTLQENEAGIQVVQPDYELVCISATITPA